MTFRIAAVVLLTGTIVACAVEVARLGRASDPQPSSMREISDPMAVELARCKALGPEAANDQACKSAWGKSRERFLAPRLRRLLPWRCRRYAHGGPLDRNTAGA